MDLLVSAEWLAEHFGDADLVAVDCSWHMAATGRNGRQEFVQAHIPGARFLDIDEVRDAANPAPHMLPSASSFSTAMEQLGIGSADRIVVYDNSPLRTAARGWFMLRHFGARQVAILDGGFQRWVREGRPTESGQPEPRDARFVTEERDEVVSKQQLLSGFDAPLIDARGKARFDGNEADPRPGVAPGHIPGARNLPFSSLYDEDGCFRSKDELRAMFEQAGVDPSKPFVATCGSGVTANGLIFAAALLGNESNRLYDGSWSEWGADPKTPKALGAA